MVEFPQFFTNGQDPINRLIFRLRRNGEKIEIGVKYYELHGEQEFSIPLEDFKSDSEEKDNGETYNYFISMIYLLSDLCLDRNYRAIEVLKWIYPYKECFKIISDNTSKLKDQWELRTAFTRLTHTLHIDKEPYQEITLPRYMIFWDELTEHNCQEIVSSSLDAADVTQFDDLKEFFN